MTMRGKRSCLLLALLLVATTVNLFLNFLATDYEHALTEQKKKTSGDSQSSSFAEITRHTITADVVTPSSAMHQSDKVGMKRETDSSSFKATTDDSASSVHEHHRDNQGGDGVNAKQQEQEHQQEEKENQQQADEQKQQEEEYSSHYVPHSYHSWGKEGADLDLVLRYINTTYMSPTRFKQYDVIRQAIPIFIVVTNNTNTPRFWLPQRVMKFVRNGHARLSQLLPYWQKALGGELLREHRDLFPALVSVLTEVGSLPLIFDLADYRGCPDPAYNASHPHMEELWNTPIFAFARSATCPQAFPIPSSFTYDYADKLGGTNNNNDNTVGDEHWIKIMAEWEKQYPWENKTAQAYWRGTCRRSKARPVFFAEANSTPSLFNLPSECLTSAKKAKAAGQEPQENSMKYKLAIDIDGNSWSERFPRLLCFNSAIVKVTLEEDFEEYFMTDLEPNVHFIPASLDNFTLVTKMALQNDELLQNVVRNANAWCRERIRVDRLNLDFFSVLNGYVETLNRGDPMWTKQWQAISQEFLGDDLGGFIDAVSFNPRGQLVQNLTNPGPWKLSAA